MNSEPLTEIEGHARLAGHGAAQQRLAGARRPHQEHALGHAAAQSLKLLRVLEELDDLFQFALHAFQAGHVVEGDGSIAHFIALGRALAEAAHQPAEERIPRTAQHEPQPTNNPTVTSTETIIIVPRAVARLG